jgi:broad specificity phosphatase PhoE
MTVDIDALRAAMLGGPTVLMLRHAPRGEIRDPTTGDDVLLTPEGFAEAEKLGESIGRIPQPTSSIVLAHSPVRRCEQTVIAIHAGLARSGSDARILGERGHLGGPYLRDSRRALAVARDLGPSFVRSWFDGKLAADLVQPLAEAATEQVHRAIDVLDQVDQPRLAILVSHDWNLMMIREHFFGVRHENAGWIDFLDGVMIRRTATGISATYRARTVSARLTVP